MVTYALAVKGDAPMLKKHLPFVCPDVNYIERMLSSPEAIVILAKDKAAVVGAVGGWLEGTPSGHEAEDNTLRKHDAYHEAHLDWIAVAEQHRKKRIGATLVQNVCKWALNHGKKKSGRRSRPKRVSLILQASTKNSGSNK